MALKDNLKHFKDFDDYSGSLTKADLDNNLDLLADNIDTKADKSIVGIVTDGTTLKQQNDENKMTIGTNCQASGDYSFAFGKDCEVDGYYSFAFGEDCQASGDYSFAFGEDCIAENEDNFVFGFGIKNKQTYSKSFGINVGNVAKQNLKHFNSLETTDETQTDFQIPIFLWIKSLNYIIIKCEAIKDDYSTKWIFERKLIVLVDKDGKVTIDSDDNTDIKKDDNDWKFDIESTDDSENPTLKLKATGKADTTIAWGIEVENRQTYFTG